MKIATWNVNGIRARKAQFAEWLEREQPDVVCLQEIKATPAQVPVEICEPPGYLCYWHGGGGYSGVSLHVRAAAFSEVPEFTHPAFDHENRIVQARTGDVVFASVYVPNGGKDFPAKMEFLTAMVDYVTEVHASGRMLVMCGDYNVARTDRDVHPKERKPNIIGQRSDERALLERIIGNGLVDVGRTLDPDNDNLFTWWAPWRNLRERNIGWRLDYVLASEALARRAVSCQVYREFGTSDHGPVIAVFA
jgi:exodeoxyribonuclease-3